MKALVAFLGILVVLGTAVVVGVVIKRLYAPPAPVSSSAAASAPAPAGMARSAAAVTLPTGSRIVGLAGAGNGFAVWVSGPSGARIYLLDPATSALRLAVEAPLN